MSAKHTSADRAELRLDELIIKHGLMDEAWPSQRKLEAFALDALARSTDAPEPLPPLPPKRGRGYCDADMRAYALAAVAKARGAQ